MDNMATRKQAILGAIASMQAERTSLRGQLAAKAAELTDMTTVRDRLQAFIDTPDWGALESGAAIQAGDVVRFGALTYTARSDHTKALTRSPINLIYWEVKTDVN